MRIEALSADQIQQVREIIQAIQEYNGACYIMFSPEVMLGATGPVNLAGALAQHNAEVLAGVVESLAAVPGFGISRKVALAP